MFDELKSYLGLPSLLNKPKPSKELYLYLVVSPTTISQVLVWEDGRLQKLIYHISKILYNTKSRYLRLEKMIFAFVILARKLRPLLPSPYVGAPQKSIYDNYTPLTKHLGSDSQMDRRALRI